MVNILKRFETTNFQNGGKRHTENMILPLTLYNLIALKKLNVESLYSPCFFPPALHNVSVSAIFAEVCKLNETKQDYMLCNNVALPPCFL